MSYAFLFEDDAWRGLTRKTTSERVEVGRHPTDHWTLQYV